MADATREEAVHWARMNNCRVEGQVHPPPPGWMWAECGNEIVLTAIFTGPDWPDITFRDLPPGLKAGRPHEGLIKRPQRPPPVYEFREPCD